MHRPIYKQDTTIVINDVDEQQQSQQHVNKIDDWSLQDDPFDNFNDDDKDNMDSDEEYEDSRRKKSKKVNFFFILKNARALVLFLKGQGKW